MKLIRSLIGRRQFLMVAGAASASALAFKRLARIIAPGFQTNGATASDSFRSIASAGENAGTASVKTTTNKYPHLLSPLKIRNKILKNRILLTPSPPHSMQGPENFPADAWRNHYSNMAKNAAIVTIGEHWGQYPKKYDPTRPQEHYSDSSWEDIPPVHNYLNRLIDDIHCEGSLVCCGRIASSTPSIRAGMTGLERGAAGARGGAAIGATVPQAQTSVSIEDIVTQAKKYEDKGYDAIEAGERSWSGIEAVRADIEKLEAVRNATNLLIVAAMLPYTPGLSRAEPYTPGLSTGEQVTSGPELEEIVAMAKMIEGVADIIRMKDIGHATNHPNSFSMEKGKPWMLRFAQAIKESGNTIITCPTGGFHEPEVNEEFIASGKTDMVGMATPLFADPEYVKKLYDGRADDIVPCVRCHNCHGISRTKGPWYDTCTVNPKWATPAYKLQNIRASTVSKKVAVIGGGPGGMKAALVAAERGHNVTLYEKNDSLGGLQRHTDFSQWTWAYKDFKDYLIRQVNKAGVEVKLKTTATPEMIKAKGYDTVLVATGAEPIIPKMPGADGKNVYNIDNVYFNKKSLGKNVVIIGAGTFGTETGICLAKDGHKVTLLTSRTDKGQGNELIDEEDIGPHNKTIMVDLYQHHPNFSYIMEATATHISEGKVFYKDATGSEKSVQADSVVIYAGLRPRMDEAVKFSGSAGQVVLLGDCTGENGTIQKTIRNAFFVASQV